MRRAARGTALAAAVCVLGGCGGGSSNTAGPASTPSAAAADAGTIRAADCRYWNATDATQHRSLLAAMRAFFGATADNGERGATLSDSAATRLLDGACKPAYARAFKLYKLYGRAAAFTSQG